MPENIWTINDSAPVEIAQEFQAPATAGTFALNDSAPVELGTTFATPAAPSTLVYWGGLASMAFDAGATSPQTVVVPEALVSVTAIAPAVTLGAVTLPIPVITVAVTSLQPAISLGAMIVSVPVASVNVSSTAPDVYAGWLLIAVPAATVEASVLPPDLTLGTVNLEVPVATVSIGVTAPMTGGAQSVAPPPITVNIEVIEPTVMLTISEEVFIVPAVPSIGGGWWPQRPKPQSVRVSYATARMEVISPIVTLGAVRIKAPSVGFSVEAIAPRVSIGEPPQVTVEVPVQAEATAPAIRLGAVTVTPERASLRVEAVAPEVWISELIKIDDMSLYVHRDLSMSLIVPKGVSVDLLVSNGEASQTVEVPF